MINPFSNPSYLLPPLVVAAVCIILIALVWNRARQSKSRWIFCGLLLSIGLWSLLTFGMRSSPDVQRAVLWVRPHLVVGFAIYILYYHFTVVYTNASGQRGILVAAYSLLVVGAALAPTDLIVVRIRLEDYGYAPVLGPIAVPLVIGGLSFLGAGIYNLVRRYDVSYSHVERNRLLYLSIAPLFPVLGALLDGFTNLPPAAIWGNLIFCILCSIAILKYHLLDIRVVAQKSLTYLLVSAAVAIPYVAILYLIHYIFKPAVEPWWIHAVIILFLAIILRPLYSWAQQVVDRLFYRDRYDYLRALERFSREAQSVTNLDELGSTMVKLVSGALRTSSVCLLLPSESKHGLVAVSSTGLESPLSGVVLRDSGPIVKWLKLHENILSSEELDIFPKLQSFSHREKNNLERMGAKLYVPIQTGPGQLSGILVLGQKLSQQPYSSEDRQLLTALSSQMAMALENARLYNESQREVAERKQAEQALKLQKAYFQQLFDNSPEAIVLLDTDDRIVQVNKGFHAVFGYRAEEIKGQFINEIVVPEDRIEEAYGLSRATLNNEVSRQETVRKRKDGSRVDVDTLGYPIRLGNKTVGVYVIYSDITERKRAEEEEKRLQQELYLSSRLASVGELAAGVAHEINNPLTGILGFSQRLLRRSVDKEVSRDLERIHNEALRAAKVVQNLLTFARRREPKKQYSDINDIVQKALELRAYELKTGNIEVITDLTPNLPQVVVDLHQIQEVFLNIILNAEQAVTGAKGGGKLSIKTQQIKKHIRISFSDDGPGVPAQHLDKLFDPFFTTRGEMGGTGLGLSICHGIVTEHGGRIYVKSKPEKGATFFVELPIMSETVAESRGVKEEAISRSK